MTESTFMEELGIGDPRLVGYVAGLLTRFVPSEAVWNLRDGQGRRLEQVVSMIEHAELTSDSTARGERHRHVGDFTLFWSGVYPEALARMRREGSGDSLIDFCRQGKLSYEMASRLDKDRAPVLRQLSAQFELCAFGLSRVRKEWEKVDGHETRAGWIIS